MAARDALRGIEARGTLEHEHDDSMVNWERERTTTWRACANIKKKKKRVSSLGFGSPRGGGLVHGDEE